ncbi:MAG: hypothetical protein WBZ29_04065 [Methanocella sp.]
MDRDTHNRALVSAGTLIAARRKSASRTTVETPNRKTTMPNQRWPDAARSSAYTDTSKPAAVTMFGVIPVACSALQTKIRARSFCCLNMYSMLRTIALSGYV